MFFGLEDKGHFRSMTYNWPEDEVDVIVVTDGSRVLGLGDLGSNSANIPIGKLALYVAGGGINPQRTLPVVLDFGTDNEKLRDNNLYVGLPRPRIKGPEYFELVDEWMDAVRARWPNVLIQFEDFNNEAALPLLRKYRNEHLCFNDDIQSTGCIAAAAVMASLTARGLSLSDLGNERIVCAGAGSAGLGVCEAIVRAMVAAGANEQEARKNFCLVDQFGAIGTGRNPIAESQIPFVQTAVKDRSSLYEAVEAFKPTVLLGLSGVENLFTEKVVRSMAANTEKPVIFPLSNPISKSECSAEQAFAWTDGRAIFASGSPYDDVDLGDGRVGLTSQCNNVYSFPGMGLAVTVLRITRVTDSMFHSAAVRISQLAGEQQLSAGRLFPPVEDLRAVSAEVAASVARIAIEEELTTAPIPDFALQSHENMVAYMRSAMWEPEYATLVAD
jgi:malic enzyme